LATAFNADSGMLRWMYCAVLGEMDLLATRKIEVLSRDERGVLPCKAWQPLS